MLFSNYLYDMVEAIRWNGLSEKFYLLVING